MTNNEKDPDGKVPFVASHQLMITIYCSDDECKSDAWAPLVLSRVAGSNGHYSPCFSLEPQMPVGWSYGDYHRFLCPECNERKYGYLKEKR